MSLIFIGNIRVQTKIIRTKGTINIISNDHQRTHSNSSIFGQKFPFWTNLEKKKKRKKERKLSV